LLFIIPEQAIATNKRINAGNKLITELPSIAALKLPALRDKENTSFEQVYLL
jgi:hypothetical protein